MILWNLKRTLQRIGKRAAPDREFVLRLQSRLAEKGYVPTQVRVASPVWRPVVASTAMLLSLSAGTATYAYASDTVLPDHPLYGVRLSLEKVENRLAFSVKQQEQIRLKHAYRRLNEVRLMAQKNRDLDAEHAETVASFVSEAATMMRKNATVEENTVGSAEDMAVSSSDLPEVTVEHALTAPLEDAEDKKKDTQLLMRRVDDLDHQLKTIEKNTQKDDEKGEEVSPHDLDEVEPIEDAEDQI